MQKANRWWYSIKSFRIVIVVQALIHRNHIHFYLFRRWGGTYAPLLASNFSCFAGLLGSACVVAGTTLSLVVTLVLRQESTASALLDWIVVFGCHAVGRLTKSFCIRININLNKLGRGLGTGAGATDCSRQFFSFRQFSHGQGRSSQFSVGGEEIQPWGGKSCWKAWKFFLECFSPFPYYLIIKNYYKYCRIQWK